MALIVCDPKEVNLRQLESELGCTGINVCINPDGSMLVEAPCTTRNLQDTVDAHKPNPDFVHPDDAAREQAQAQEEQERAARISETEAKLAKVDLTLDQLREALGR